MSRPILSCILLLLTANLPADGNDLTPQQLIDRMSRATHELNYDGIFIYRRGRAIHTMRIIHKNGPDGEMERLVSLTGHPREVIRNNKSVTCIFPDDRAVMVEKSRPQQLLSTQLPEPIEKISNYYHFSYASQDRIAGHDVTVVEIKPNDNYRYGYRLWIDKHHHLLLKSELKNTSGLALEETIFTKLDVLDAIPDELLKPSISGEGYTWYDSAAFDTSGAMVSSWSVNWMPAGFAMSNIEIRPIASSKSPVDHLIYSDGMAMVSVFIEKINQRSQFVPGPTRMGAVNAFSRKANGYQVTAVGEVPQATVRKMATSVISGQ